MPTSGRCAGTAASSSPVNGQTTVATLVWAGEIAAAVAAQHAEREVRRAGRVRGRHAGVRVLLELERRRPAVLDRVAEPVQRADAGVAAPREDELPGAAHPDQLVVDDVGRHPDERQVAPPLADQLVPGRVRDQVREALERDGVAVADELGDRLGERDDHVRPSERERMRPARDRDPAQLGELVDRRRCRRTGRSRCP